MINNRMWDKFKRYLRRCLIAFDQLINTVLSGWPDETFSARAWRKAQSGDQVWRWICCLINLVFFREKDHCRQSYESERQRRHLPVELRGEF